ncbi:HEPN domain-containing protein [Azoarcus sp. DD4]|uniref:HEPN domain-containing protein n=1 Tax=Azoarcus sp. DD4 TaxID=2027405 RepID=UPI00112D467A|nr:HEPN domain-containing protein [Azoarcus sp. DD4]
MPFLPFDAARACIGRSRRFLALAEHQNLPDPQILNDLRRTAVVMAVAAIDSYMHWLVFRRLSDVRREGDLPKSLAKLSVPFSDLASLADALIAARRANREIRPWVQVKNSVQKELLRETFQSYEQVANALALSGVEKGWSRTAVKIGCTANDIKERLNRIVHRRNQVVHEGDITRASRPQNLKYNSVAHDSVVDDVTWIEALLTAIEEVVNEGNPA